MRRAIFVIALLGLAVFAGQASASPGAYRVLIAEAYPALAKKLQAQVAAFPDVATVDLANTGSEEGSTPTVEQLASYDVVVSIGDSSYLDPEAWGNSLAGYVDSGGVVVQAGYDSWDGGGAPTGRFTPGYAPFIPGNNGNNTTSLGSFDASSPLMQGVSTLTTEENTEPELAPGATLVAKWANEKNAIAVKGRVVAITAYIGDSNGEVWSGNYGQIVVNAVRALGRQTLTVVNSKPAGGTVTSSPGGISCGALCSAPFIYEAPVKLRAKAKKGFAFAGFSGDCKGATCALTMDTAKSVTASFASFEFAGFRLNEGRGTARIKVRLGAPGGLVLSGAKVKSRRLSVAKAGKVAFPVVAKGKAAKALRGKGRTKVEFKLAFTPKGGATTTLKKSLQLKLGG